MTVLQQSFPSRWGFHPCDHLTYRKLKFLNLVYLRAVRMARAWERWRRKAPHNRVSRRRVRNEAGRTIGYGPATPLPEPPLCTVFSRKVCVQRYVDQQGTHHPDGYLDETVVTDDRSLPEDYTRARHPVKEAAAVLPLHHSAVEIENLYEQARFWVERQDVE